MLENKYYSMDWNAGNICFYHETWSDEIHEARIRKISGDVATLHDEDIGCELSQPMTHIFKDKESAMRALEDSHGARVKEYCSRIDSVEDLVRFAYDEVVSTAEEYTNWDARKAYAVMAKKLLGIRLDA